MNDAFFYPVVDVNFECPLCREQVRSSVGLPEFDEESSYPRHGFFDLDCPECRSCICASVEMTDGGVDVRLKDHPDTIVETEGPGWETSPRFREAPPANPWERFMDATDQIRSVMQGLGSDSDGSHMVNRMVFTQYIAAFEAYLAETLVRNVEGDPSAIRRLVDADPTLKAMRFSLAAFLDDPNIVLTQVRSHLRNIVYHRLPQVNGLYLSTLGIKVLSEKGEADLLIRAVELRHDCVHRNGFDRDGVRLKSFMPEYIEEVAATLIELVGRVESSVQFKGIISVPKT